MPFQLGRPVYISIRSYQAWLESFLAESGAKSGPRQALMVKHLVSAQRAPAYANRNGVVEKRQPAMISAPGGDTPIGLVQSHRNVVKVSTEASAPNPVQQEEPQVELNGC
jgi:hypothetical protein